MWTRELEHERERGRGRDVVPSTGPQQLRWLHVSCLLLARRLYLRERVSFFFVLGTSSSGSLMRLVPRLSSWPQRMQFLCRNGAGWKCAWIIDEYVPTGLSPAQITHGRKLPEKPEKKHTQNKTKQNMDSERQRAVRKDSSFEVRPCWMGMDNVLHIIMNNDFMILFCSWHSPSTNSNSILTVDTRARRDPWEASLGIPLMGQPSTRTDVKVSVNHPQQKHTPK